MILTFHPRAANGKPDTSEGRTIEMTFQFGAYSACEFLWYNARNWYDDGYEFVDVEMVVISRPEKIKITERFQWNETEQGYRPIDNNGLNGV